MTIGMRAGRRLSDRWFGGSLARPPAERSGKIVKWKRTALCVKATGAEEMTCAELCEVLKRNECCER